MSNRTIQIDRIPTTEENRFIDVSVSYTKGGPNMLAQYSPRGYYVHVQPIKLDGAFITIEGFTGVKQCVQEANRFSARKLATIADEQADGETIAKLVAHVAAKQGITLANTADA